MTKKASSYYRSFIASDVYIQQVGQKLAEEARLALIKNETLQVELLKSGQKFIGPVAFTKNEALQAELFKSVQEFIRPIFESVLPVLEKLQKKMSEDSPRIQEALLLLGEHGWYFDFEIPMTELWKLNEHLAEGYVPEVEAALIEHFERRLDKIEKSISDKYPHRSHLITAAFDAHRRQDYVLSIPVLLSQTDGIGEEVMKESMFMRRKDKKPRTATYVDQNATNVFIAALLSPLTEPLPIIASKDKRTADFNGLYRHAILHGESLDYGSKVNSLKAVSLINYIVYALEFAKETP